MTERNCTNMTLVWDSESGDVALIPWPWSAHNVQKYGSYSSGLADYTAFRTATESQRKTRLFIEFAHLVLRDGIDPSRMHNVLLALPEWRDGMSRDVPCVYAAAKKYGEE